MRRFAIIIALIFVAAIIAALTALLPQKMSVQRQIPNSRMIITSPSFKDGESIPKKFTCDGGNINPQLDILNVPEEAKSLALIMHDPDAPMPGGFTHWVVWNIDPSTATIKQESVPPGSSEGKNSRTPGYTGPCPPSGTHHYHFMLYALDATLTLPAETGKGELEAAMKGHILAETRLVGLYQR